MVKNNKVDKTKLYENMVKSEKDAYLSQDHLLDTIKKWFLKVMDEKTADETKIILAHGGYIQIRTVLELTEEQINDFTEAFNFVQTWFRDETMTDYRNVDPVTVRVFEYAFIPKNIDEILGNNQVDLGEGE